jgi:hypothetical protein
MLSGAEELRGARARSRNMGTLDSMLKAIWISFAGLAVTGCAANPQGSEACGNAPATAARSAPATAPATAASATPVAAPQPAGAGTPNPPGGVLEQVVEYELGDATFQTGDAITIAEIQGDRSSFQSGGLYRVRGSYTLASRDRATLAFFFTATERGQGSTREGPKATIEVARGSGSFELIREMPYAGWPHISFYPAGGGSSFGGVYFGKGATLKKNMPPPSVDRIGARD